MEKGLQIMFNGTNCGRNSQLSGILTEPLNPRDFSPLLVIFTFPGNLIIREDVNNVSFYANKDYYYCIYMYCIYMYCMYMYCIRK